MLEVFNNLFMAIAEQMGVTLANTSYSVNIKERLDFSCALFDAAGNLIANAPHMPVHLGSMGESVATIIERRRGTMSPGDVFVLNAPYNGGTHLPDVTVIAPVFMASQTSPAAEDAALTAFLRRIARPPRRHRWHHARIDAARFHRGRRGGRAARQCAAGRGRPVPRRADADDPALRPLSGAQRRAESRRPARAGRRLRQGRRRARENGCSFRAAGRARVHAARAGQRRGGGASRRRSAIRRRLRLRDGQRRRDPGRDPRRSRKRDRRRSISPARARSSRRISTRPPPYARRRSSTSFARSSTTTSR